MSPSFQRTARDKRVTQNALLALWLIFILCTGSPAMPKQPAPLAPTGISLFSNDNGGFAYVYYLPNGGQTPYPLVLALHGCDENPTNFEAGTRWFEDASANGYAVVMPQHLPSLLWWSYNPLGCWPYWNNHYRGQGEPQILVALIRDFETRFSIDRKRVYVAGMSSGAAMAVALAADYPDVFAAAASASGSEYEPCIDDLLSSCWGALRYVWLNQDPMKSGHAAYREARGTTNRPVPMILFQGDQDTVVLPFNLTNARTSIAVMNDGIASRGKFPGLWTANGGIPEVGKVPGGYTYEHYSADSQQLDWTIVHGMGHAWSGGVADSASTGSDGGNYNDPKGPSATVAFRSFLLRYALNNP